MEKLYTDNLSFEKSKKHNNKDINQHNDEIIKLILEENKILKKTITQKYTDEKSLLSLVNIMEIQRDKINRLEEGNFLFY